MLDMLTIQRILQSNPSQSQYVKELHAKIKNNLVCLNLLIIFVKI